MNRPPPLSVCWGLSLVGTSVKAEKLWIIKPRAIVKGHWLLAFAQFSSYLQIKRPTQVFVTDWCHSLAFEKQRLYRAWHFEANLCGKLLIDIEIEKRSCILFVSNIRNELISGVESVWEKAPWLSFGGKKQQVFVQQLMAVGLTSRTRAEGLFCKNVSTVKIWPWPHSLKFRFIETDVTFIEKLRRLCKSYGGCVICR